MKNKRKIIMIIAIVLLLIMLIPIKVQVKNGDTEYKAILYKYIKMHRPSEQSSTGYEDGWELKLLGHHVAGETNVYVEALPKITIEELEDIHKAVGESLKKYRESNEYNNFASSGVDRQKNRLIIELIDNSKKEQQWFRDNIYDSEYIVFKQGGPYYAQAGGSKEEAQKVNQLIIDYFQKEEMNYNLSYNYVDEKNNVVIVGLIENTLEKQNEFINTIFTNCCDADYIKLIKDNKIIQFKESKSILEAKVTSIDDNKLVVKVSKNTEQFKKNDKVIVHVNKSIESLNKSYEVGNNVKITFGGLVLTSNPPQIDAYNIEIIN